MKVYIILVYVAHVGISLKKVIISALHPISLFLRSLSVLTVNVKSVLIVFDIIHGKVDRGGIS